VRSGNVPLRGGGSRKRGGKSFATDTLIETKRMTKHAKMAEKVVRLSDNLIDEGELIDDGEKMRIVEFERSIDNLRRKIMTKLL
jgi:polyhydroxyalkanoate synthesis regulator phasin